MGHWKVANDVRNKPARLAWAFTLITCGASWAFLWGVKAGRLPVAEWAFPYLLMWIPGAVALGIRALAREGFADAGFRVGKFRWWAWACLIPLAMATLTYAVARAFGQVELTPYLKEQSMYGPWPFKLHWPNAEWSVAAMLASRFAIVSTLGICLGYIGAVGEEIGWRGFLLPKLIEGGIRRPILLSGVIWGVWHVPFVLMFYSRNQSASAALYLVACVAIAPFFAWLRLGSGSVFVAAMAHAAYNSFYQEFFDHSFAGGQKWFWAGDVGVWCSVCFGLLWIWLSRSGRLASRAGT